MENPSPPPTPDAADRAAHFAAIRARKKAEAEAVGVDAVFIGELVDRFYTRIRHDALLGPIFAAQVTDWDIHLPRMKAFWRSILHNSGEFSGSPMAKHAVLPGLEQRHFAHWLDLFYATLHELAVHPAAAAMVGERARMIADSLLTGYLMQRDGLAARRAGETLPRIAPTISGAAADPG